MGESEWPRLAICFLTDANTPKRTEYALRSVRSVSENLIYPNRAWYIALDGESDEHLSALTTALADAGEVLFGFHAERTGPGPSWNRALKAALGKADLVMWLENDWALPEALDIQPYGRMLLDRPEVGMVRLGLLPVGLDLHSVGHAGIHYLRVEKSQPYAYSGNPSVRHRRYFEAYQVWYPERSDVNPGDCEIYHDNAVRATEGPEIWWPVDLGGWGMFQHIGQEQSY